MGPRKKVALVSDMTLTKPVAADPDRLVLAGEGVPFATQLPSGALTMLAVIAGPARARSTSTSRRDRHERG